MCKELCITWQCVHVRAIPYEKLVEISCLNLLDHPKALFLSFFFFFLGGGVSKGLPLLIEKYLSTHCEEGFHS